MDIRDFENEVKKAVGELPPSIRKALGDTAIVIDDRCACGSKAGRLLLGYYEGVPLTSWGREYSGKIPDKITIFKRAIEEFAGKEENIPHVIRETVWHEIGHYFGLDHARIRRMEKRWRGE